MAKPKKSVSTNKETILTLNLKKTADAVNEKIERIKSIIKNGLVDIETEDLIFKGLFEIRRIKEF